ncbi:MAG: glycosyl hydrolase, partial [Ignavibacteriaceae bacterium]|nr:glycosyl hydrolase [Ignavibacteriaceae bacterium]
GVGVNLLDVFFIDSLYGWAVGDSGIVIATSDGGGN